MKRHRNRKNLPIDVLRSFVAIVEYGGFTQAGEVIGRSQAAISLQIKKLEEGLSLSLFERNGHSFKLTASGELLMEYARQILSLNDRALAALDSKSVEGRVRLGIPSEFATTLLPKIVGRFSSENPNVSLEVNCDLSKNLLVDSERGRYDLVLGLHTKPEEAGRNLIKSDRLVWVTSRDFDLDINTTLPVIAAPEGCIYRQRVTEELNRKRADWRIVYTIQDLSGIKSAIEVGLGVTVLAESTVPKTLRILADSEQLPRLGEIGISMINAGDPDNRACSALATYVQRALTERMQRSVLI